MGRGDRKTRKGKISIRSYGNVRPHASKTSKTAKPATAAKSSARPVAKKVVPVKKTAARKPG
ncbi:MAG TPA: 30S ribosomal protein THX [Rhodanobacteraceae bacterium]|jgi:ribosomal small subunit protein bTHX|nr:30S ribosomal protein THX [Rhodanobacteraceae bacterium]